MEYITNNDIVSTETSFKALNTSNTLSTRIFIRYANGTYYDTLKSTRATLYDIIQAMIKESNVKVEDTSKIDITKETLANCICYLLKNNTLNKNILNSMFNLATRG